MSSAMGKQMKRSSSERDHLKGLTPSQHGGEEVGKNLTMARRLGTLNTGRETFKRDMGSSYTSGFK